jgi:amino acid permease
MKMVLETYKEIFSGNTDRKIHALFTLAIWFCAGAYLSSTLLFYILPYAGTGASMLGGLIVASIVATLELA